MEFDEQTILMCASLSIWAGIFIYLWALHFGPLSVGEE